MLYWIYLNPVKLLAKEAYEDVLGRIKAVDPKVKAYVRMAQS